MCIRDSNIAICNSDIENVNIFKYLRAVFTKNGRIETELDPHILAATKCIDLYKENTWEKKNLEGNKTGSLHPNNELRQSHTLNGRHKIIIQSMEDRFLRNLGKNKMR